MDARVITFTGDYINQVAKFLAHGLPKLKFENQVLAITMTLHYVFLNQDAC